MSAQRRIEIVATGPMPGQHVPTRLPTRTPRGSQYIRLCGSERDAKAVPEIGSAVISQFNPAQHREGMLSRCGTANAEHGGRRLPDRTTI